MVRINSGENSTIMIQKYNDKLISLKDYIYGQVIFISVIYLWLFFYFVITKFFNVNKDQNHVVLHEKICKTKFATDDKRFYD